MKKLQFYKINESIDKFKEILKTDSPEADILTINKFVSLINTNYYDKLWKENEFEFHMVRVFNQIYPKIDPITIHFPRLQEKYSDMTLTINQQVGKSNTQVDGTNTSNSISESLNSSKSKTDGTTSNNSTTENTNSSNSKTDGTTSNNSTTENTNSSNSKTDGKVTNNSTTNSTNEASSSTDSTNTNTSTSEVETDSSTNSNSENKNNSTQEEKGNNNSETTSISSTGKIEVCANSSPKDLKDFVASITDQTGNYSKVTGDNSSTSTNKGDSSNISESISSSASKTTNKSDGTYNSTTESTGSSDSTVKGDGTNTSTTDSSGTSNSTVKGDGTNTSTTDSSGTSNSTVKGDGTNTSTTDSSGNTNSTVKGDGTNTSKSIGDTSNYGETTVKQEYMNRALIDDLNKIINTPTNIALMNEAILTLQPYIYSTIPQTKKDCGGCGKCGSCGNGGGISKWCETDPTYQTVQRQIKEIIERIDWLEWLKQGKKGDKGADGKQGEKGEKGDKADEWIGIEEVNVLQPEIDKAQIETILTDGSKIDSNVFNLPKGQKGDKGDKGEQGEQGIQGQKGDKGEQGEQGIQGQKGDKGDKGEQGEQGEQGIQGNKGDKGDTGATIKSVEVTKSSEDTAIIHQTLTDNTIIDSNTFDLPRGLQGEKGDKGDKGDKGEAGDGTGDVTWAELNPKLDEKADKSEIPDITGLATKNELLWKKVDNQNISPKSNVDIILTQGQVNGLRNASLSGDAVPLQQLEASLETKQDHLTAGQNIVITDNVISAVGSDNFYGYVLFKSIDVNANSYVFNEFDNEFWHLFNIEYEPINGIKYAGSLERPAGISLDIKDSNVMNDQVNTSSATAVFDGNTKTLQVMSWDNPPKPRKITHLNIFRKQLFKADVVYETKAEHDKDVKDLTASINGKQDALVSGNNIKTINGESVLGSGDIVVAGQDLWEKDGIYAKLKDNSLGISMQNQTITDLIAPLTRTQATNKGYVDDAIAKIKPETPELKTINGESLIGQGDILLATKQEVEAKQDKLGLSQSRLPTGEVFVNYDDSQDNKSWVSASSNALLSKNALLKGNLKQGNLTVADINNEEGDNFFQIAEGSGQTTWNNGYGATKDKIMQSYPQNDNNFDVFGKDGTTLIEVDRQNNTVKYKGQEIGGGSNNFDTNLQNGASYQVQYKQQPTFSNDLALVNKKYVDDKVVAGNSWIQGEFKQMPVNIETMPSGWKLFFQNGYGITLGGFMLSKGKNVTYIADGGGGTHPYIRIQHDEDNPLQENFMVWNIITNNGEVAWLQYNINNWQYDPANLYSDLDDIIYTGQDSWRNFEATRLAHTQIQTQPDSPEKKGKK